MSLRQTLHDHPLWVLLGLVLFVALGYVLAAFVGTVIVAVFVYYAARPIYRQLTHRIENRTAAGVSIIALVLPALALVGYALLIVSRQLREVADVVTVRPQDVGISPELYNRLTDPTFFVSGEFREVFTGELAGSVVESLVSVAGAATAVGVVVINLFAMIVLAFYLLRDDRRLAGWLAEQFDTEDSIVSEFGRAVDRDLSSIFFGNILNAIITGTIAVIAYSLLNVIAPEGAAIPAAALIGLLAGVASLIPVIGMKIVYVPVGLYMAARGVMTAGGETLWFVVVFAVVSIVIIDLIPDIILRPYVSGKNIHIGLLMLAYILGPLFFGWYGLFLMPALLVVFVQFGRIVLPALVEEADDSALPPGVGRIDANPLRATVGTAAPEATGADGGERPQGTESDPIDAASGDDRDENDETETEDEESSR